MATYQEKRKKFLKIESEIQDKYSSYSLAANPIMVAEMIKKVAADEVLKDSEFIMQFYLKDTKNCADDLFFTTLGSGIQKILEGFTYQNYKFVFYLAEKN